MTVEPVPDEPAAVADCGEERALVLADYHAGLETALRRDGVEVRSRAADRRERTRRLLVRTEADRVVFLDENGDVVQTDRSIVLLAQAALESHPGGGVVYDIKCTDRVPEEVRRAGGEPLPERSGHAFIKTRLLRDGAAFAGEASGHFFFAELGGDDGIYAALTMGRLLTEAERSMSELAAAVPDYHITPDIRIPVEPGGAPAVIERVREAFADRPQDDTDGVRVDFEDGWALVRPSVTEPVVTLRCEADTEEALGRIRHEVEDLVRG